MKFRPSLSQVAHYLMIVTLCFALWTIFINHKSKLHTYKQGDRIAGNAWRDIPSSKRTILIIDRADCVFCRASMPFYAKLAKAADGDGVPIVSITPDDPSTHKQYLLQNGVNVVKVVPLKETSLSISGTPTLIVVDEHQTVLNAWIGKLDTSDENKVLRLVNTGSV